jgi:C-terminal processing protease CtpA/Prc
LFRACTALVVLLSPAVFGQQAATEQDRLIAAAKLWTTVKYFHPYLAYRNDIDWDKALVDALPKVRSAHTAAEYADALESMLHALQDPATYARIGVAQPTATAASGDSADPAQTVHGHRTWIHFGLTRSAFAARPGLAVEAVSMAMGEGVEAVVHLSEPISSGAAAAGTVAAFPSPEPDRAYNELRYPPAEYRILAAYKIWGAFHYFFAYRDLMDEDWDDVFNLFLPVFISAKDAREYNLAVTEMITHVSDSHAVVESRELNQYFGESPVGLRLRLIEKKPAVARIVDENAVKAGIRVGDIITGIDGEDIIARVNREARYISSSTQQALGDRIMRRILNGPEGSTATLTVRDAAGESKHVSLTRDKTYYDALDADFSGETIQLLPGNIGYVELHRLKATDVDGVFEKLGDTKAIIFDARGAISGGLSSRIAAHLTEKTDVAGAIVTGPLTLTPDLVRNGQLTSTASYFSVQALPPPNAPVYKGKTVMLIDERTIGEAEHLGLFLEAANNTAFIGSASAGADGEVTRFFVPGGVLITFSSTDVRHANTGKLQRLGLQPNQLVLPTLAGIRAGRDEVLERAIEYLSR